MINSTAVGGGVAEILNRLVPLAEELDLSIRWDVMQGAEEFFDVTKSFHNALHGEPYQAKPRDFEVFLSYNEQNRATLPLDAEFVVIHDPQPAALINARRHGSNHWVWRCHIDLSTPNPETLENLLPYLTYYPASVFHLQDYVPAGLACSQDCTFDTSMCSGGQCGFTAATAGAVAVGWGDG